MNLFNIIIRVFQLIILIYLKNPEKRIILVLCAVRLWSYHPALVQSLHHMSYLKLQKQLAASRMNHKCVCVHCVCVRMWIVCLSLERLSCDVRHGEMDGACCAYKTPPQHTNTQACPHLTLGWKTFPRRNLTGDLCTNECLCALVQHVYACVRHLENGWRSLRRHLIVNEETRLGWHCV